MSNFEWQTDEDIDWQPLPPEDPTPPRRRSIRLLTTLFFLVIAAACLLIRQAALQIEATTETNRIELFSTATLLVQAEQEQDLDLLALLISGSDMGWVMTQRDLLDKQLIFEREQWGLTAVSPPTFTLATLSPDLIEAELTATQQFVYTPFDGIPKELTFTRPLRLRRGENRWLLSPNVPDDFWGATESINGRYLTIFYPKRDQAHMPALLAALEAQLEHACTSQPQISCTTANNSPLTIRFENDPAALLNSKKLGDPRFALHMPTPSLLGTPDVADPAQQLADLYAPPIVAAALYRWQIGTDCCDHMLFHQALIDRQLDQLGLRRWPLTPASHADLLTAPLYGNSGLNNLWRLDSQPFGNSISVTQTYALIEYLLQSERDTVADMQRRLADSRDFYDWAQRYIISSRFSNADYRDWLRFVITQAAPPTERPAFPSQTISLLCSPANNQPTGLVQYDLATGVWRTLLEDRRLSFLAPLPHDDGLLLLRRQAGRTEAVGSLWQNGRLSPAIQTPLDGSVFRVDPLGNQLLLYRFSFGAETADYSMLDPTNCSDIACSTYPLAGATVWSPSRSQALSADPNGSIWLADSKGLFRQRLLGRGQAPFWLDEQTAGFATAVDDPAIVLQTAEGEILAFIPLADLLAQTELISNGWQIHAVQPISQTSMLAIALKTADDDNETAVLLLDTTNNQIRQVHQPKFGFTPYSPFGFSPDGRWLTVQSFNKAGAGWVLDAIDWQTEQIFTLESRYPFTFPGYDWSANSQWLLRVGDGMIQLHHPDTGFTKTAVHDFSTCYFAAWTNSSGD